MNNLNQIRAGLRWQDVLDVLIVSFVLYKVFSFIKETRAIHLIRGLLLLVVIYFIAHNFLGLKILTSVLQNAATLVIVAIPVLFQPELRRALSELGRGFSVFPSDRLLKGKELFETIRILVATAQALSEEKTGALVVIERKIGLNEYIESGVMLDGVISQELLHTIFFEGTPLHDGAVILRGNRLVAAAVQLPLTESKQSPAGTYWGMRHRAALGISEQSDAGSLVVSEETGAISLIVEGKTHRNLTEENLERLLMELFQMGPGPSEGLSLRGLLRREPAKTSEEDAKPPGWLASLGNLSGRLFFNLRFIAVAVAIVWGLAVGIWKTPTPPNLAPFEVQSKEMLLPIDIVGENDKMGVTITPSQINLKLLGKDEDLQKMNPDEIKVFIQLENTQAGEQMLPVKVQVPPNVKIAEFNPMAIQVKIVKLK